LKVLFYHIFCISKIKSRSWRMPAHYRQLGNNRRKVYYISHQYNAIKGIDSLYSRYNSLFTNFPNTLSYMSIMNCRKEARKLVTTELFINFCWLNVSAFRIVAKGHN
jgi:hypothetical protein